MFHFPCNSQRWKYVISSGNFYLTSRMWPFAHFPSLRFKKSIIEKLNNFSFVLCKNWIVWPRLWCTTACWISIAFFLRHRVYIWQISMKKTFIASTIYSSWQFKAYWNSQVIQRCYQLNAYSNSWRSDKAFTWKSSFLNSPVKFKVILYEQQSTLQYTSNHSHPYFVQRMYFPGT
jgi:hypothetical protein